MSSAPPPAHEHPRGVGTGSGGTGTESCAPLQPPPAHSGHHVHPHVAHHTPPSTGLAPVYPQASDYPAMTPSHGGGGKAGAVAGGGGGGGGGGRGGTTRLLLDSPLAPFQPSVMTPAGEIVAGGAHPHRTPVHPSPVPQYVAMAAAQHAATSDRANTPDHTYVSPRRGTPERPVGNALGVGVGGGLVRSPQRTLVGSPERPLSIYHQATPPPSADVHRVRHLGSLCRGPASPAERPAHHRRNNLLDSVIAPLLVAQGGHPSFVQGDTGNALGHIGRPTPTVTPQSGVVDAEDVQAALVLTEMMGRASPAVSVTREGRPASVRSDAPLSVGPAAVRQSRAPPAVGDSKMVYLGEKSKKQIYDISNQVKNSLREVNQSQSRPFSERNHEAIRVTSALEDVEALEVVAWMEKERVCSAVDKTLDKLLYSAEPMRMVLDNLHQSGMNSGAADEVSLKEQSDDRVRRMKKAMLAMVCQTYSSNPIPTQGIAPPSDASVDELSADDRDGFRSSSRRRKVKRKRPFGATSDTDSEASSKISRKRQKKVRGVSNLVAKPTKPVKTVEVLREGPDWNPERLTDESLFIMGSKANKALGLGATRGRIYTKHPDLFRFTADSDSRAWLQENHRATTSGGKSYMFLVDDILKLAKQEEYYGSPNLMLDELTNGFTIPPWMVTKAKQQMETNRSKPINQHLANALGVHSRHSSPAPDSPGVYNDTDSDRNVPFLSVEGPKKSLSHNKSPSPEELELMSSDGTTDGGAHGPLYIPSGQVPGARGHTPMSPLSPPTGQSAISQSTYGDR